MKRNWLIGMMALALLGGACNNNSAAGADSAGAIQGFCG
jgi:hypothetical protein